MCGLLFASKPSLLMNSDRMDAKCGNKGAIEIAYVGGREGAGLAGQGASQGCECATAAARGNAKIDIMRMKCACTRECVCVREREGRRRRG